MNPFDPSQMDPKVLMELSQLIQQLPPSQLSKMQSLMHNAQAGFDVRGEMEEFEKGLPPGFREKILSVFGGTGMMPGGMPFGTGAHSAPVIDVAPEAGSAHAPSADEPKGPMDVREARLTILRAVAEGRMTPDEADRLLFT